LFGGAQSAKTFFCIYYVLIRALKYAGSTHAICRHRLVDVKAAILVTLFPEVLNLRFKSALNTPNPFLTYHMSPPIYIEFFNNSKIFFLGLDDKLSSDKILGRKFSDIVVDEISEVSYSSYSKLLTRLSENNEAKKVSLCTMNPTSKKHWSYKLFLQKVEPRSNEPLRDVLDYGSMNLNPSDNLDNLPDEYISILESLSTQDKERFLYGRFSDDLTGTVYAKEIQEAQNQERICESVHAAADNLMYAVFDLGINDFMAVWIVQYLRDKIVFLDYFSGANMSVIEMIKDILDKGYNIGGVYLPFDAKNRWVGIGLTVEQILIRYSVSLPESRRFFVTTLRKLKLWQGINACRIFFKRCYFALPKCEGGLDCLKSYRYEFNDNLDIASNEPVHDWASHGADAFRYAICAYNYTIPFNVDDKPRDQTHITLTS
jgi:phage terminase large subunit